MVLNGLQTLSTALGIEVSSIAHKHSTLTGDLQQQEICLAKHVFELWPSLVPGHLI